MRIVMIGAGASNTTIARLCIHVGADPHKMVLFDTKGALHTGRDDIKRDPRFYRKWELCERTNPGGRWRTPEDACKDADVMIALSSPCSVNPEWVRLMGTKPIVFACANPVPEIYPTRPGGGCLHRRHRPRRLPNQVNNSRLPWHPQGRAAGSGPQDHRQHGGRSRDVARCRPRRGSRPSTSSRRWTSEVFEEAAAVAMQAVADGVARRVMTRQEVCDHAARDIQEAQRLHHHLMETGFIPEPPTELLEEALRRAIAAAENV